MENVTSRILISDKDLSIERYPQNNGMDAFSWFRISNSPYYTFPEGLEVESGEVIYSLIRMMKAKRILETGTRVGISTRYMAYALLDNCLGGEITTIERCGISYNYSREKITSAGLDDFIDCINAGSLDEDIIFLDNEFDILFLDTEPEYRYAELMKFFRCLRVGGLIVIHDLSDLYCEKFCAPYDSCLPMAIKQLLSDGILSSMSFKTCSGLTIMQKNSQPLWERKHERI